MSQRIIRNLIEAMLASATVAGFAATSSSAQPRESIEQGVSAPFGVHALADTDLLISSPGGRTVERVGVGGARSVFLGGILLPNRIVCARDGRLLIANRSEGQIVGLDTEKGTRSSVACGLSRPVGVVEMPDGSIVSSQYGGRVTRILPDGKVQELGASFNRPGVGILADGDNAVLVIDNGASVVRRASFDGQSSVVVDGLSGARLHWAAPPMAIFLSEPGAVAMSIASLGRNHEASAATPSRSARRTVRRSRNLG